MSNNLTNFPQNFAENTSFTDTGSDKTTDTGENSCKNATSDIISPQENQNPLKNNGFSEETQVKSQVDAKNSFSASTQQVSQETTEKKESPSTPLDLFSEANKEALLKDFPQVDLKKLQNSDSFQEFLGILNKNPTLSQAYACFNSIIASAEKSSQNKLLQALANAGSGVGALSSSQGSEAPYFTREQVLKMSPEQIKANYNHIRKSQAKW